MWIAWWEVGDIRMDLHAHMRDVDKEGGKEEKIEREWKRQRELKHLFTQKIR